ncbi:MAG: hypothetical protein DCC57_15145 [Chloroflexi bacterium]|nr:MAG: hypothetical protein DCC57_15145 [Chloroflexota bacterium]
MSLQLCRRLLIAVALALLGGLLAAALVWFNLGFFLDVSAPPARADAIIVMGGEGGRFMRSRHAVELYAQGFAPTVVFSGGTLASTGIGCTSTALSLEAATGLGLPAAAVRLAPEAQSTLDEAANLRDLAAAEGWTQLLIVTDRFHTRRARQTLAAYLPGVMLQASAPDDPVYEAAAWWRNERSLVFVVNEALKLGLYWIEYGIRPVG